jgi:NAD(P)H-nitrite reductase large subunit
MGWGLAAAHGRAFVEGATIGQLDADWRLIPGTEEQLACDTVCCSYGLAPFSALPSVAGAQLEWRPELGGQVPVRDATFCTTIPGVYAIGDGAGIRGARMAMLEGEVAGIAAAALVGYGTGDAAAALARLRPALAGEERFGRAYAALFTPGPGAFDLAREDTVVCRCEGVTLGMLRRAAATGATTLIEAKADTRCGMGECQGRMCDQAIAQMLARLTGRGVDEIGLNRARPPIMALPLGALTPKE